MRAASGRRSSAEPSGRTVCTDRGVISFSQARRCPRPTAGPTSTRSAPAARVGNGSDGGAGRAATSTTRSAERKQKSRQSASSTAACSTTLSATRSARSNPSRSTWPGSTTCNRPDSAVTSSSAIIGTGASASTPTIATTVNRSRLNLEPTTAAALNVRLAFRSRRSMRAAMVACSVAGTPTSATSAVDRYAPRSPRSTPRWASSRTISSAKNGLPAALSTIVWPTSPTVGSGPSKSATNTAVSESLSGPRATVWAPAAWVNAPRYSGGQVTSTSEGVCGITLRKSASIDSLIASIQWASSTT